MKKRLLIFLSLLLVCLCPCRADDRSDIKQLLAGKTTIDLLNIDGPWAAYFWSDANSGGMGLLHKLDGKWQKVAGGGGVMNCHNLFVMGVPKSSLANLLHRHDLSPYRVSQSEVNEAVKQGPEWLDLLRGKDLQKDDLQLRSDWELTLMRNEIYAVYGRTFQDPELRRYFEQRAWYRPDPAFRESRLSERELRNARFISEYQRTRKR